jgi:toxin-antitoxin system PIN domain toxin
VIVDANVLLYAVDGNSTLHGPARDWFEAALNGDRRIGLPWVTLNAFLRISTHPRASAEPLSPTEAWEFVIEWLEAELTWVPEPTSSHADVFRKLMVDGDLRGNLVTDTHIAALAVEHGVSVCSFDSDFGRFPGLRWISPLHG